PISIYTGDKVSVKIMGGLSSGSIDLPLAALPSRVVLDEQYHVMRHLTEPETPPVLAALLGDPEIVAVIPPEKRDSFQPLMEALGIPDIAFTTADKTFPTELGERNLLIADSSSNLSKRLFGEMDPPGAGVRLRVFKNPFHANQRILVADVANKAEAEAIQQKLRHYGKYSDLAFNQGRNIRKEIAHAQNGILIIEPAPSVAVVPDQLPSLDRLIPELLDKRVVFVGEQHNRFEHHINQLHIIQQFHMAGFDFGVGMEMFKKPFQGIIDAYLADEIDERTFLNQTRYFEEWGYDYHLYKPIVDFIKKNRIPLIALNLPERITRQVSRSGIETLDPADKNLIPESLDFSDTRYARDLREVFALHNAHEALEDFNYFYQAQVLWDETMADTAFQFLREFPQRKLIVLAGNGHLRYRYGIPKRLQRRITTSSAMVLQDEALERDIADYVLQTTRIEGARSPKLGVAVEDTEAGLQVKSVADNSPAQTSGLEKNDIITRLNHIDIHSLADLRYGLFTTDPGRIYPLQIMRDGHILDKEVDLFDFPPLSPHGAK
ncbi:MAG: ChaN family lipoprotein, partial [Deltaproteobacteria bacterium]|nr:ChaN family lipoprotein [Deltaproteobacteria bacterium]